VSLKFFDWLMGMGVLMGRGRGIRGPQLSPFKPRERWELNRNSLSTQDERIFTVDDNLSYDFPFPIPPTKQRQKKLPLELSLNFQHMPNRGSVNQTLTSIPSANSHLQFHAPFGLKEFWRRNEGFQNL
jgi:hypothetical protein